MGRTNDMEVEKKHNSHMHTNDHDSWKYVQLCLLMSEMNDEMIQHKNMPGWCQNENKIYKKKREKVLFS